PTPSPRAASRRKVPRAITAWWWAATARSMRRRASGGGSWARRRSNAHDPEKWEPVFRKDHAQREVDASPRTRANKPDCLGDRPGGAAVRAVLRVAVRRHGRAEPAVRQSGVEPERRLHLAQLRTADRQRSLFRRAD